jgi:two-component system cell cycle response regulator CpdR
MATILIVEDESQVRVFAESYLRRQGHRTITAATVEEALTLIEAVDGVDVLFSEVKLKDDELAGVRLAKQAARRQPGMKIVYAAEYEATDGLKSLLTPPAAVLLKPYRVCDLKNALGMPV